MNIINFLFTLIIENYLSFRANPISYSSFSIALLYESFDTRSTIKKINDVKSKIIIIFMA